MNSSKPSSARKTILFLAVILLFGTLLSVQRMFSAQSNIPQQATDSVSDKATRKYMPVETVKVELVDHYSGTYQYTGKVTPRRRSLIGFEISGRIEKLNVDDGDIVYDQQVLGVMEKDRYQNKYQQTLAQKSQAEAVLKQLDSGRKEDIESAKAQTRELEAEFSRIDANLKRQQELFEKNVITREAYEQTYFSARATHEKLNAAKQSLLKLEQGGRAEEKQAQVALIKQLSESLQGIQLDIDDCELKAPYSGKIVKRLHDEGEVLNPGTPIFELIESGNMEIRIGIPVASLKHLQQTATYTVNTSYGELQATWKKLIPEIDPKTRTQTLILTVSEQDADKLLAEDIVRISVKERVDVSGYWLPTAALVQAGKGLWGCYVLSSAPHDRDQAGTQNLYTAEIRIVETLYVEGSQTLVRGTLKPGEQVITTGVMKIVNGQVVQHLSK